MSDAGSVRSSSRASTLLNRPNIIPVGPRTRQSSLRVSGSLENSVTSTPTSPLMDLPEFGSSNLEEHAAAAAAATSPSSPASLLLSNRKLLPALPSSPDSAPPYHDEETPVPSTSQERSTTPVKVVSAVPTPPKLVPPPAIKFETTTPVPWKGMPLEAALWTIDSKELQGIVSRAIKSSAKESFIRLLTVDNFDKVLPAELERLGDLKAATQSKYRFLVHRRTMLFHALNSTALAQQKDGEDGVSVVSRLASQLSETIEECDQQLEEVLKIVDQMTQINKLIDHHWASALAIALRKLNGSYSRRVNDLTAAKERITQLEAELEDAWKEAEKMAGELDDYEAAIVADDAEAVIETAEIVPVPKTPTHARRLSIPMTPTLLAFTPLPQTSPTSTTPKTPLSPTRTSSHFVFPPEICLTQKQGEAEPDVPDAVSIRSVRSTRSAKSTRSHRSGWTGELNHMSSLQAAKKRSYRASQSSLRLNTTHLGKNSSGRIRNPHEEQPPLPDLPLQFSAFNSNTSASPANAASTLPQLEYGSSGSQLRRQMSLDSVLTNGNVGRPLNAFRGRAADDLYVRPNNQSAFASEIQLIARTPPRKLSFASTYQTYQTPPPSRKDPSMTIPSMWRNADVVKPLPPQPTSASYVESTIATLDHTEYATPYSVPYSAPAPLNPQTPARNSTYAKIRGLTKRYSVSLPLLAFNSKLSQKGLIARRSG